MTLYHLFEDKSVKAKERAKHIAEWLLKNEIALGELLAFAEKQLSKDKATCIEAIESATNKCPTIADEDLLSFITKALRNEEPRVKWESAKVIGNIAKQFPDQLDNAIHNLLHNAENNGNVVRWATAYALAEIVKLRTENLKILLPKIEALCDKEEDHGVKKKYLDALNKVGKWTTLQR